MNLLLVNLTRFGDLLQMQPVLHGLRAQGHRTALVCLEHFAGAAQLLDGVDHVAPLPASALLAGVQPGADWRECTAGLLHWAGRLREAFAHDAVLNLTATLGGRLLGRLLAGEGGELRGFGLDPFGFGVNADPWSAFLQASTRKRGCSPFNLVDLFRMAAGVGSAQPVFALRQPDGHALAEAAARLHAAGPAEHAGGHAGYVAMQLGASENRRRWPVAHFAVLAQRLWRERRLVPVLLGSGGERELGERLRAMLAADAGGQATPCVDLIGATDLPQLAATLRCVRLLVTNDTGTMHLAAGLGVPVLAIFLATAQPWDTGPYREGSCCLEPALDCHPCPFGAPCPHDERCRHAIAADTVCELVQGYLSAECWQAAPATRADPAGARVWLSVREPDAAGEAEAAAMAGHGGQGARPGGGPMLAGTGFMDLRSLSGHEPEARTRWIRLQRHFYRQFLDRPASGHTGPAREIAPPLPCDELPEGLPGALRTRAVDELRQADALLHLMGEQGGLLRVRPSDMAKSRFLGTVGRVQALWDNSGLFNVLGHLWMCESQEAGADLDSVLALAAAYRRLVRAWHDHLATPA